MSKLDLNITRTITVNTGNYESVKPTVGITVKDVDVSDIESLYSNIQTIADVLLKFEIVQSTAVVKSTNKGIDSFCRNIIDRADELETEIDTALENINKINTK
jgi:hypothetical protein